MSRSSNMRAGALLLEVVVSLAIMVAALGLIGAQLNGGLKMTAQAESATRAAELSDRMLALLELDQQMSERIFQERHIDGDFGTEYPGYLWRAQVDKTDIDGLGLVSLEILYQNDPERPTDIDGARLVRQLHLLKADPGRIDLGKDFGVPQETLDVVGPSLGAIPGLDPTQFDPQALAALPPEQLFAVLAQLLPILQQAGIIPPGMGLDPNASPDDLSAMIQSMVEAQGGGMPGQVPGQGGEGEDGNGGDSVGPPQQPSKGAGQNGGGSPQATPNRGRNGNTTSTPRNNAGGRGTNNGANQNGTRRNGSGTTLDDLRRMSPGSGGNSGAGTRGGNNNRGNNGAGNNNGSNGNNNGRNNGNGSRGRTGNNSGGASSGGQQHYTIEDLMRMRDQANQSRGGR